MKFDALVVGAGPVGCIAAGKLARQGYSVLLLEEHRIVGKPMQCGGLISPRIRELVEFPFDILNCVKGAFVYSPNGKELILRAGREKGLVVDRTEFDQRAALWAVEQGVTLNLGCRIDSIIIKTDEVKVTTSSGPSYSSEMIIGADGPSSITARAGGLPRIKEFVTGYEIEAIGKPLEQNMVEAYTGQRIGEGFFSWVIPFGGDRLRIGSGIGTGIGRGIGSGNVKRNGKRSHSSGFSAQDSLRYLLKESIFASRFADVQPISIHGGAIPIGMRDKVFGDRLMVVGDAAGLAKPVSGGGVITGIISAGIAAEVAGQCIERERYSYDDIAPYQKILQSTLGKELKRASKLRNAFMHLSDHELETFFSLLTKPKVLARINEKGDLDYPGRMAIDLLKTSPGLVKFAIKYLGAPTL